MMNLKMNYYPLPKKILFILFIIVFVLPLILAAVANSQDCSNIGNQVDNYIQLARNDMMNIGSVTTLTRSEIYIAEEFSISDIILRLELEHDFVGDLVVTIISPENKKIVLHNKTLGTAGTDGLYETYTSELDDYIGDEAYGTWTLSIDDSVPRSDGTLKYWSMTLYPEKEANYIITMKANPEGISTGESQSSKITATVSDADGILVPTGTGVLFTTDCGIITGDNPPSSPSMILPEGKDTGYAPVNLNDSLSVPMFVSELMFNPDIHQLESYMNNVGYVDYNVDFYDNNLLLQSAPSGLEFPSIFLTTNDTYFGAAGDSVLVNAHLRWNIPAGETMKIQFGLCSELDVLDGVYKGKYVDEIFPLDVYQLESGQIDVTVPILDYTFGGWEPNLVYRFYAYILDESDDTSEHIISSSFVSFNFGRGNSTTNNKGEATATLRPENRKKCSATISASALGAKAETTVVIGSESRIQMRAEPTQLLFDGKDTSKIFVSIKDDTNQVVPDNTPIEFSCEYGGSVSPSLLYTLAGKVEAEFTSSDPGSSFEGTEIATVEAFAPTLGIKDSIDITLLSYSIDLVAVDTEIPGDGSSFTVLTAILKDYFHNAIVGREVVFTSDAGIISTMVEGIKTNVTDETGKAFAILTSERGNKTANVCARYVNEQKCIDVAFIGASLFVSVVPSDILADGNAKADIETKLTYASGGAFPGEKVSLYIIHDGPPANGILDLGDEDGVLEYGEDWEDIDNDGELDEGEYNAFEIEPVLKYLDDEQFTNTAGLVYANVSSTIPGDALVMAFASGIFQSASLTFTEVIKFKVIAGEDLDGDGKSDFINEDLNFNGIFDFAEDEDEDGNFDIGEDLNSNGILDDDELDWDFDGAADATEDLNGDGLFDPPSVEFGGKPLRITAGLLVNGGNTRVEDGTIIQIHSTVGSFSDASVSVSTVNGIAVSTLYSSDNIGEATITAIALANTDMDGNPDNDLKQDITTTVKVDIVAGDVDNIILKATPDNVRIGKKQIELDATCLDFKDNPVSNAVVSFKIMDGPGGGEYINPGTSKTNYTGKAKSFLYSGDIASAKSKVQIQAYVIQGDNVVNSNTVELTISGLAHDIALGEEFGLVDPGEGVLQVFITALVSDINGNPVADGTKVNFSEQAILFDEDRNNSCGLESEDYNEDGRLNINEDLNGNLLFDRVYDKSLGLYDEDLDGDGHFDVGEDILRLNYTLDLDEDINKNGVLDLNEVDVGKDLDGDGWLDDTNEDEALPGTKYYKNGIFDDVDIDGDGFRDEDLDFDRHFDTGEDKLRINRKLDPGEDLNNNGKLDLNEDINNNFILDPGEDFDGDDHFDVGEDGYGIFKVDGILNTEDVNGDGGVYNVFAYWDIVVSECIIDHCGKGISFSGSEDINGNGILDYGEDINGNGILDPEDGTLIDASGYTLNGKCTVTLTYLKKHALNIVVKLTAEADGIKNSRNYPLPKPAGGKDKCEPYGWSY